MDLHIAEPEATRCSQLILATKDHAVSPDPDFIFFTDADLSILGKDNDVYTNYCQQIRKEYKYYPDIIYKPGRQKVLNHFLGMKHIYKTPYFQDLYEEKARKNLEKELTLLK
jgi:predicted metal-dependent HD superfamily phosphohydrolase